MDILGLKLFEKCKDGGPQSPVDAYVLIEWKRAFSVLFLKFNKGCREDYHSHAFNALTWFVKGNLVEERLAQDKVQYKRYTLSVLPKVTLKDNLHRVKAYKDSWCFTLRGPWQDNWTEFNETTRETIHLTKGRKVTGVA